MKEITLTLTVDEANIIIEALSKMSFAEVYKIIEKIHLQAKMQQSGSLEQGANH
jgi:hypothetical protein